MHSVAGKSSHSLLPTPRALSRCCFVVQAPAKYSKSRASPVRPVVNPGGSAWPDMSAPAVPTAAQVQAMALTKVLSAASGATPYTRSLDIDGALQALQTLVTVYAERSRFHNEKS